MVKAKHLSYILLLGLIPMVFYAGSDHPAVYLVGINILLLFVSLHLMFGGCLGASSSD